MHVIIGESYADTALSGTDCSHCESFSLASLLSLIAFFSESDSAPHALPFSSSQGPVRKKLRGRGFDQPVKSKLTSAQCMHASPSPQREHLPVLFTQHHQHPSAAAPLLSLAASDTEELSGSVTDPALLPSSASHNARLIRVMTKGVNELGLKWSPSEEPSRRWLDEWFLLGHHQPVRQRSFPFFPEVHNELTKSWRAPYSSHIRPTASAALTSDDGAEEKGYKHLPPSR